MRRGIFGTRVPMWTGGPKTSTNYFIGTFKVRGETLKIKRLSVLVED